MRHLSGVGALWDCLPRVRGGGGGCAGGGVPLVAVPALSWCGEVFLGDRYILSIIYLVVAPSRRVCLGERARD